MPFLSPNQQCLSTEGKISHSMELLTPSSLGGLPTLSLTTKTRDENVWQNLLTSSPMHRSRHRICWPFCPTMHWPPGCRRPTNRQQWQRWYDPTVLTAADARTTLRDVSHPTNSHLLQTLSDLERHLVQQQRQCINNTELIQIWWSGT